MKVLFDHQIFSMQKYGGISRYFCELMNQFNKTSDIYYDLAVKYSENYYLRNGNNEFIFSQDSMTNEIFYGLKFKGKDKLHRFLGRMSIMEHPLICNLKDSIRMIRESNYDLFHPTYFDTYFLKYIKSKPFVVTIYDMIHEIFSTSHCSEQKYIIAYKKMLIDAASRIIAISENTKKDIIDIYDIEESRISVVYLGCSFSKDIKQEGDCSSVPDNFILYVGERRGYKNFKYFLKSIAPLLSGNKGLYLVCAGSGSFTKEEKSLIVKLGLTQKIIHLPLINDNTLIFLYRKALCFVFPTLYEGFGIPILEAFACGCPVILSNRSSLPEVAGDAAVYFNPEDGESILSAVSRVLSDGSIADYMKQRGYVQLEKYSWENCATGTKMVYQLALQK